MKHIDSLFDDNEDTNQYGYRLSDWDLMSDETKDDIRKQYDDFEAEDYDDSACCIPRSGSRIAIQSTGIELTGMDNIETLVTPEERATIINDMANGQRVNKGENKELTEKQEKRIDTLTDQGSWDQAFRFTMKMSPEQFYGDPKFNFESPKALDIAEAILAEKYPNKTRNFRKDILEASKMKNRQVPEITSQEAADLMRLIELRNKKR